MGNGSNRLDYWKQVYEDLKSSGLSAIKYSEKNNIPYCNLNYYKRKFESKNQEIFEVKELTKDIPAIDTTTNTNKENTSELTAPSSIEIKIKDLTITINNSSSLLSILKSILKN